MKRTPIAILPEIENGNTRPLDLLERQNLYFSSYQIATGNSSKPIVFYTSKESLKSDVEFPNIETVRIGDGQTHFFSIPFHIRKELKRRQASPRFIVAGTPFQPFLLALMVRIFFPKSAIQISIHGELSGIKSDNFSGFLKFVFLRLTIKQAKAVRFVSKEQKREFQPILGPLQKTVVTPVPIPLSHVGAKPSTGRAVGFVGRLHHERGVDEWLEIAKKIPDIDLLIIGDGPEKKKMMDEIQRGEFLGFVAPEKLLDLWPRMGVLLSAAPYESYGLALREALLNGVPVVSRDNAGSRELRGVAPDLVSLYTSVDEAIRAVRSHLNNPPKLSQVEAFMENFKTKQRESLQELAQVWLGL